MLKLLSVVDWSFQYSIIIGTTMYIFEVTLRTISCTLERPFNDFMYSLFNRMYLSLTKLNFRCAFMFSNPLLRDRLFCVVPKRTLSVFRKE
jgi:hypothetical protein